MKKTFTLPSIMLAALLLVLTAATPDALAQVTRPNGGAQGSVQNGVYTWSQAGYSLSLPSLWIHHGYKWYETWGTDANTQVQGTRFINEWIYTPVTPGAREETLLTITVYDKAAWDAMAAQGGPLPSVAGQTSTLVYTMRTPQGDPYPQGSVDSQRFRDLSTAMAPALSHFTLLGASGSTTSSLAFTSESLKNATYKVEGTPSGTVTLTNGEYRVTAAPGSASQVAVKLTEPAVVGTLNGHPAAAAVVVTSGGGSGTFYYLTVVVDQGGKPVNVATTLLGDRVKINGVSIVNNQVVVDLVTQGPNDPMASPTSQQVWKFELQGDKLVKVS